jgi:hypothetical protein
MALEGIGDLSKEQIEEYAASTEKIANAVVSLTRHDGWGIFMALLEREFAAIKEKSDYAKLEDFKADRAAIAIVEDIIETFKGYIEDAESAQTLLAGLAEEAPQDRGILLIEHQEGAIMEG